MSVRKSRNNLSTKKRIGQRKTNSHLAHLQFLLYGITATALGASCCGILSAPSHVLKNANLSGDSLGFRSSSSSGSLVILTNDLA